MLKPIFCIVISDITSLCFSEDASKRHPFPCPTTFRIAFAHYLDICAPPRMNVLKELAEYCEDDEHKTFLTTMSSNTPEGKVRQSTLH